MRGIVLVSIFVLLLGGASQGAAYPEVVKSSYHTGYLPFGFDSNDRVQVVGEGYLPSSCYKVAYSEPRVDSTRKTITLTQFAYKYSGVCLQMLIPYYQVIDLGIMEPGDYEVVDGESTKTLGKIQVKKATNVGPDDFLYAPISQAFVERLGVSGHTVRLEGAFPSSCMFLKEVRTYRKPEDVVVMLPIVELKTNEKCEDGRYPFSTKVELRDVPAGKYLLHVRALDGQAVNRLIEL